MTANFTHRRPIVRLALSRTEVALSIGVSAASVDQMVAEGALPPPRKWHSDKLWLVSEMEAFLNNWPIDGQLEEPNDGSLSNKRQPGRGLKNSEAGQPHVYSPRTLAAEWDCTERHIRNLITSGYLKAFRVGTLLRISTQEAREYEQKSSAANVVAASLPSSDTTSPAVSELRLGRIQRKRAAARLDIPRPKPL